MATASLPPIGERVAAGATLLDTEAPGWAGRVDPEQLSVHPLSTRVSLAERLRDDGGIGPLLRTQTVARGVCLSLADFDDPAADPRVDLLDAWRREITRRQQHTTAGGGRR